MKCSLLCLPLLVFWVGCSPSSPKPADSPAPAKPVAPPAADLGKTAQYFTDLYGVPKSDKQVSEFSFSFPNHGSLIRLSRPLTVQEFESDRLTVRVVYAGQERRAIWVKYTLPNPWTSEQINAALKAYGNEWKSTQLSVATSLLLPDRAPTVYQSSDGTVGYKTLMPELMIYAPQLFLDLQSQVQAAERAKKAVPKF
jgi:hypothetical protein